MGFALDTRNLPRLRTWQACHTYFNGTDKPRSDKWDDYQRPLRKNRDTHLKIKRTNGGGYELWLYNTIMATHYRPAEDGTRVVDYVWWDSQSSRNFMWAVCGIGWHQEFRMDDGTIGIVAYSHAYDNDRREGVDIRLTFNADDQVIRSKSWHNPAHTMVRNPEALNERATVRKLFKGHPLFVLLYAQAAPMAARDGRHKPYHTFNAGMPMCTPALKRFVQTGHDLHMLDDDTMRLLQLISGAIAYNAYSNEWEGGFTLEKYTARFMDHLLAVAQIGTDKIPKYFGQFPSTLPKSAR